nr:SE2200 family small protein [Staphylococcus pseudintermedius]
MQLYSLQTFVALKRYQEHVNKAPNIEY